MGDESRDFFPEDPQPGPSWQRANWPQVGGASEDDLTQALDPMALKAAIKAKAEKPGAPVSEATLEAAALDSLRLMNLVRTYRVRGHLAANLDPLGLTHLDLPADLTPEFHGFLAQDMDRRIFAAGILGLDWTTVHEVIDILRANYCGKLDLEYTHIAEI